MAKTLTIQSDNFKKGLQALLDDSKADWGSAREMINCQITDRGGIAPRPGTVALGAYDEDSNPITGLYNFRKSKSQPDILMKSHDGVLEYFHPTLKEWAILKDGFTEDKQFDFTYTLVNTDNDDFTYFCNSYEEYQRWSGAYSQLTVALSGGETEITVESVLEEPIYATETATANSATTVTVASAVWATDMWKNFYVYFPLSGKIRLITGNSGTVITFSTLGGAPGNVPFEIRQLKFPLTGSIVYDGEVIAYTAFDVYNKFPVSSANAAPINTPVAVIPTEYIAAPRGNRIDILRGRVYVGHVRMAISRDASGNTQGSSQAGSVFVSKLLDPTSFTFAATRVAGEGDILAVPYGGGDITDIQAFEKEVAIYKNDYIEIVTYTEDTEDLAVRTPLKPGYGSVSRVIKGSDDHYFMTPDKKYTSLGRVRLKDVTPQSENIAYIIKRLLDQYNNDNFNGIEFNNRIISSHKSSDNVSVNDVMLVYNRKTKSFEGIWQLGANNFDTFQETGITAPELVYGESNGGNVWKMFQPTKSDIVGATELPYTARWQSNFFNVLPIKSNMQAINSVAIEGYIGGGTTYTFNLYSDFGTEPILSFDFGSSEEEFMQGGVTVGKFFSSHPLGLTPLGALGEIGGDGRRRFSFIVYFPYKYCQYLSSAFSSTGKNQDWEIERVSYGLREDVSVRTTNTKTI